MKKKLLVILFAAILTLNLASAAAPSGTTVINGSEYGPITNPAPGAQNVTAGYIQEANIDSNQTTLRWAGLTGNVSGNIQLGDGASTDVMYNWAAAGNLIYASVADPDWTNLSATTGVDIDGNYTYLSASDADSANVTFASGPELIGSNLFAISSVYAATLNSSGGAVWKTYALFDGTNDLVIFAGKVDDQINFRNDTADFQMIVPEEGTNGDTAALTYKIWVELI